MKIRKELWFGFVLMGLIVAAAVGMLSLQRVDVAMGTVEVAFVMFGEGARRAAPGTEAIYLLARHVFDKDACVGCGQSLSESE